MNGFLNSIGGGFAGLLRFRGRDSRARFWPYAIFVFALGQVVASAAMTPAIIQIQLQAFERAGRAPAQADPFEAMADMAPFLSGTMRLGALIGAVTVVLLAAAVVRRLHDCDRTGKWGLLPLPFLAAAATLAYRGLDGFTAPGRPDFGAFAGLFLSNMVYLAALGWLVYLMVGEGTAGPNRFGPPPE